MGIPRATWKVPKDSRPDRMAGVVGGDLPLIRGQSLIYMLAWGGNGLFLGPACLGHRRGWGQSLWRFGEADSVLP